MKALLKYTLTTAFLMIFTISQVFAEMVNISIIRDLTASNEVVSFDGEAIYKALWTELDPFNNYNGCVIQLAGIGLNSFPEVVEVVLEESNPYFTSKKVRYNHVVAFRSRLIKALIRLAETPADQRVSHIYRGLNFVWKKAPPHCDEYVSWVFSDLCEASPLGNFESFKGQPEKLSDKEVANSLQERFHQDDPLTCKINGMNITLYSIGVNEVLVQAARFFKTWLSSSSNGAIVKIQSPL